MCACVGHPQSNGSYYEVASTETRRWQSMGAQGCCFVDQDAEVPTTINIVVEPPIGFNHYLYGNSTETNAVHKFPVYGTIKLLYCIVLYCIVLYCIVLYCIVLYCT